MELACTDDGVIVDPLVVSPIPFYTNRRPGISTQFGELLFKTGEHGQIIYVWSTTSPIYPYNLGNCRSSNGSKVCFRERGLIQSRENVRPDAPQYLGPEWSQFRCYGSCLLSFTVNPEITISTYPYFLYQVEKRYSFIPLAPLPNPRY